MAKARPNHLNIDECGNSIIDPRKPKSVVLHAAQMGGFEINSVPREQDGYRTQGYAAFSTLDEALAWLAVNMAQPAKDAA